MTENTAHPREAEGDTEVGSRPVHMKGDSRLPGPLSPEGRTQGDLGGHSRVQTIGSYKSRQNKFISEGRTVVNLAGGGPVTRGHGTRNWYYSTYCVHYVKISGTFKICTLFCM